MKRWIVFMLSLALTLALVTPALAAGPKPGKGQQGTFSLVGEITALDAASKTISVQVIQGNTMVKSYIGQILNITTTTSTRFLLENGTTTTAITFANLKIGDAVSVGGKLANGVWTAQRITEGADLVHMK